MYKNAIYKKHMIRKIQLRHNTCKEAQNISSFAAAVTVLKNIIQLDEGKKKGRGRDSKRDLILMSLIKTVSDITEINTPDMKPW